MEELMNEFALLDWIFLVCLIIGVSLLIARVLLQLSGAEDGGDFDAPDAPDDITSDASPDSADTSGDAGLRLFTTQGLMGFFITFGMLGFISHYFAKTGALIATLLALAFGIASLWLSAKLFASLMHLESSGNIDIRNAIGKEGSVYQRILPGGTGKVQIVIQGRLVEYEAVSSRNIELKTGDQIMVTYYKGNTLVVDKV